MMKQISIVLANRPGELSRTLGILADANVELRALSIGHSPGNRESGLVKMIVDKLDTAVDALRAQHVPVEVEEVIVTAIEDHAGGLHAILEILAEAQLNIEHMYTFVSRIEGKALSVFTFDEPSRAKQALRTAGVRLVTSHHGEHLSAAPPDDLDISDFWGHDVGW